jgi:CRISPR-associated protein Cmr5
MEPANMLQTRSQRYAGNAHSLVLQVKGQQGQGKYKSLARSLPVLIRTAGLAQALAFVDSPSAEPLHRRLLSHLDETVNAGKSLSAACRMAQLSEYMRLTRDTLDALLWFKRFAESILDDDIGNQSTMEKASEEPQ